MKRRKLITALGVAAVLMALIGGFAWVKWVAAIEVDDQPWWWQPPFPLQ